MDTLAVKLGSNDRQKFQRCSGKVSVTWYVDCLPQNHKVPMESLKGTWACAFTTSGACHYSAFSMIFCKKCRKKQNCWGVWARIDWIPHQPWPGAISWRVFTQLFSLNNNFWCHFTMNMAKWTVSNLYYCPPKEDYQRVHTVMVRIRPKPSL